MRPPSSTETIEPVAFDDAAITSTPIAGAELLPPNEQPVAASESRSTVASVDEPTGGRPRSNRRRGSVVRSPTRELATLDEAFNLDLSPLALS